MAPSGPDGRGEERAWGDAVFSGKRRSTAFDGAGEGSAGLTPRRAGASDRGRARRNAAKRRARGAGWLTGGHRPAPLPRGRPPLTAPLGAALPAAMAPGKITARIKKTLPVRGPQAPTLRELMRWYCLNTNTHGCRRIVVSRGRLRRFIWILLTLSAVGLILWQCAELLLNYYSASVSVTVQFQKLPFPAVTICNINPYK